ncbi:MAG: hypothetical protein Q8O40_05890 [Chloroflexota bacterium]|nr:hypothetical protein [Chloroflexota bacterium]
MESSVPPPVRADEWKRQLLKQGLPEVEFEGPLMGVFWGLDEVPEEALVNGMSALADELRRRGWVVVFEARKKQE